MNLNQIGKEQWDWVESKGWHNKTDLECLALITSEVGEAIQECRGNKPTDKLPLELADIILRVCDFAHMKGIDLDAAITQKMAYNQIREIDLVAKSK